MTQPELAELLYESTMWKLHLLGEIYQARIDELNARCVYDGCSDE